MHSPARRNRPPRLAVFRHENRTCQWLMDERKRRERKSQHFINSLHRGAKKSEWLPAVDEVFFCRRRGLKTYVRCLILGSENKRCVVAAV